MQRALALSLLVATALAVEYPCEGEACPEVPPRAAGALLQRASAASLAMVAGEPVSLLSVTELISAAGRPGFQPHSALAQSEQLLQALRATEEAAARGENKTGSHLNDVDQDMLKNVTVVLETTMLANFRQMHSDDQQKVDADHAAIAQCDTERKAEEVGPSASLANATQKARQDHSECRTNESFHTGQNTTDFQAYEGMESSIGHPPPCQEYSPKIRRMEVFFDPASNPNLQWYLTHGPTFNEKKITAKKSNEILRDLQSSCTTLQENFEELYCSHKRKVVETCDAYSACYSQALGKYQSTKERLNTSVASRKMFYKSAKLIVCHIKVILEHNMTHEECDSLSLDTSEFDIGFKDAPAAATCDQSAVASSPCDGSFVTAEYGALPTNVHAAACSGCAWEGLPTPAPTPAPAPLAGTGSASVGPPPTQAPTGEFTWVTVYQRGNFGSTRLERTAFNKAFREPKLGIIRRQCQDCHQDYKDVYIKAYEPEKWDAYNELLVTWTARGFHSQFDIYSSLQDALAAKNPWRFCNGNDAGIGFPRDCGAEFARGRQWTSLTKGGQPHYMYSVLVFASNPVHQPADAPAPPSQKGLLVKGDNGKTCDTVCAEKNLHCDSAFPSTLTTNDLVKEAFASAGYTCKGFVGARSYAGTPFSTGRSDDCAPIKAGFTSSCTGNTYPHHSLLCSCTQAPQA